MCNLPSLARVENVEPRAALTDKTRFSKDWFSHPHETIEEGARTCSITALIMASCRTIRCGVGVEKQFGFYLAHYWHG